MILAREVEAIPNCLTDEERFCLIIRRRLGIIHDMKKSFERHSQSRLAMMAMFGQLGNIQG